MKGLTGKKIRDFVAQGKHLVEQKQVVTTIESMRYIIEKMVEDRTHSVDEEFVPGVTYAMLFGALILIEAEYSKK